MAGKVIQVAESEITRSPLTQSAWITFRQLHLSENKASHKQNKDTHVQPIKCKLHGIQFMVDLKIRQTLNSCSHGKKDVFNASKRQPESPMAGESLRSKERIRFVSSSPSLLFQSLLLIFFMQHKAYAQNFIGFPVVLLLKHVFSPGVSLKERKRESLCRT